MNTQDKLAALLTEVLDIEQNYQGNVYISVSEAEKEDNLRERIAEALTWHQQDVRLAHLARIQAQDK
jgi:50S ribosomal subunit-associated GTPase HflX